MEIDAATKTVGLAGADLESDFILLNNQFSKYFRNIDFKMVNDSWIVYSAMSEKSWGVVSVYGAGSNIAIKAVNGETYSEFTETTITH